MAEFPALPCWTDALLADTGHLSAEEFGVYWLLIVAAWRRPDCDLPDDDLRLSRWGRVGAKKWRKMRPVIEAFFVVENGFWTQKRLTKERRWVEQNRRQKSAAGKRSALKRNKTVATAVRVPLERLGNTHTDSLSPNVPKVTFGDRESNRESVLTVVDNGEQEDAKMRAYKLPPPVRHVSIQEVVDFCAAHDPNRRGANLLEIGITKLWEHHGRERCSAALFCIQEMAAKGFVSDGKDAFRQVLERDWLACKKRREEIEKRQQPAIL